MVWDLYLFLGVNIVLYFGDLLFVVLSRNCTQCRGWVHISVYTFISAI